MWLFCIKKNNYKILSVTCLKFNVRSAKAASRYATPVLDTIELALDHSNNGGLLEVLLKGKTENVEFSGIEII